MKNIPARDEDVRWTLHKDGRSVEARIGTESVGGGQPELRLYTTSEEKGTFGMLFCQVMKDTRSARRIGRREAARIRGEGLGEQGT